MAETRWLDEREQRAWRAFLAASRLLLDTLDRELQRDAGMPHTYFEILVRLADAADGRQLALAHPLWIRVVHGDDDDLWRTRAYARPAVGGTGRGGNHGAQP